MSSVLQTLHEIHSIRLDLAEVRQQMERSPIQLKGSQNQINKKAAVVAALKEELHQLRKLSDAKELLLRTGETRAKDLRGKLNTTTNTKEFNAIKEEIVRIEAADAELENDGLSMLTGQESKSSAVAAAEADLAAARAEHEKLKEVIDYKVKKFADRVVLLETTLADLEKKLDPTPLQDYRRLTKSMGENGLASCADGVCSACYGSQPPQSVQELLNGRYVLCMSCGAMLYRQPTAGRRA